MMKSPGQSAAEPPLDQVARCVGCARQGKRACLFDNKVNEQAEQLLEASDGGSQLSIEELEVLTWFFWLRFSFAPEEGSVHDLFLALVFNAGLEENPHGAADTELSTQLAEATEQNLRALAMLQATHAFEECVEGGDPVALSAAVDPLRVASAEGEKSAFVDAMLAAALISRFETQGNGADLDDAVAILRPLSQVSGIDAVGLLATALQLRYERGGRRSDLDDAEQILRAQIADREADRQTLDGHRAVLGNVLRLRYNHTGSGADLEEAIDLAREVLRNLVGPRAGRPSQLSDLSNALYDRFERDGDVADLDEALALDREVVGILPAGHSRRAKHRSELGLTLRNKFNQSGNRIYIDEAVAEARKAVNESRRDDPLLAGRLSNLSTILLSRYIATNDRNDLDDAIVAGRQALALSATSDPNRIIRLSNLSGTLVWQFQITRSIFDLDEAIKFCRLAIAACPPGHPKLPVLLNNLSTSLLVRFREVKATADLDDSLSAAQRAVELSPSGDPDRGGRLTNLSAVYLDRFEYGKVAEDLEQAISRGREAVKCSEQGSLAERARILSGLAVCLSTRHEQDGDETTLKQAIELHSEAVDAMLDPHPSRARRLTMLAQSLNARYEAQGDEKDLDAAIAAWSAAAVNPIALPELRINAAEEWGHAAMQGHRPGIAADGFEQAVQLMPLLAWHGLPRAGREQHLHRYREAGCNAAACAIRAGRPEKAVELLEASKSTLWNQTLELHSDLTALAERDPALAAELDEVRSALNSPLPDDVFDLNMLPVGYRSVHTNFTAWRLRAGRRFDEIVTEVRRLDGFSDFLASVPFEDLLDHAGEGTVALLSVSRFGCHALLVKDGQIEVIELTETNAEEMFEMSNAMLGIAKRGRLDDVDDDEVRADQELLFELLEWLWEAIVDPVLETVDQVADAPQESGLPRIWWCPSGPLVPMPLHCAGVGLRPTDPRPRQSALDLVVSSNISSLAALIRAKSSPPGDRRMLAIGLPTTPGQSDLPGVEVELDTVGSHWPIATRLQSPTREDLDQGIEGDPHLQPTVARVSQALNYHACVHIACHATQHSTRPAASAFWLADEPLAITTLLQSPPTNPRELAVLTACDTAASSVLVPDESINLAALMHHLGYRHVVAALWSVDDSVAVSFSDLLYRDLAAGTLRLAPYAVRDAVLKIRERLPEDPLAWASFIHLGP
jgi:hypothetical protein